MLIYRYNLIEKHLCMYACVFLYFSILLSVLLKEVIKILLFYHFSICWGYHFQVFLSQMMKNLYSFMSSKKAMDNKNGGNIYSYHFFDNSILDRYYIRWNFVLNFNFMVLLFIFFSSGFWYCRINIELLMLRKMYKMFIFIFHWKKIYSP